MQMQIPHGDFPVRISLGGLVAVKLQDLGLMISKWSPLVLRLGLTMWFSKRNMRCPGFRVLLDTNPRGWHDTAFTATTPVLAVGRT